MLQTFTARSLTSEETIPLLDHMTTAVPAPDGTLLAFGGTVEKGEGLYRIAAGADGRPAAELVATTGQPTGLTYLGAQFSHLDLDEDPSKIHLKWRMSRVNADVHLKLTHGRTGETFSLTMHVYRESAGAYYYDDQTFGLTWAEIARSSKLGKLANSGHYDWSFRAVPQNGIGPDLEASGVLWLFLGKGDGTFAPRIRVGGGWGAFSQLVGADDLNNDGRTDLIGYGSGGTWAYLGTGNTAAPFTRTATNLYAAEGTKFTSVS
ncbi:FG-GAP repeat domain-containing protein [Streptomyces sp. NPDC017254]|uniref:FG-GAP repeat domain-containing protein n=1 Tax=unclassified Streptomyces TaxID=2593676 RepID=UPI0037B56605